MNIECDIAVIGAGPAGLTLANLLGAGGAKVVLIERNQETVSQPRGVSIDDEALRTMQAAGLVNEVLADVALDYGSHYLSRNGRCFAKVEPATREYGYPRRSAYSQPKLEATLRRGLARHGNVEALFGWECTAIDERPDHVTIQILDNERSAASSVRARYVAGCDGARSAVRKAVGAEMVGSTYQQRWLIIDLADTKELFRQTRVVCDPDRPTISLPGPRGTRRYEFMLHANEGDEQVTSIDFVRSLLAQRGPDRDAEIVRKQVYTFHARIADRWQTERVFLAGDAAHLSPPFAGQGMNSGIRDADNLAWKLSEVVSGRLGPAVLKTYEEERAPHAWKLIQMAILMGRVMMPTSHVQAAMTQAGFRLASVIPPLKDYLVQMKYKPKPYFVSGFFADDDTTKLVGRMFPQPNLELHDGSLARMDDLLGRSFGLISFGPDAAATLAKAMEVGLPVNNLRHIAVSPKTYKVDTAALGSGVTGGRDVDGILSDRLTGNHLLLARPDKYVAAAAKISSSKEIGRFLASAASLFARASSSKTGAGRAIDGSKPDSVGE